MAFSAVIRYKKDVKKVCLNDANNLSIVCGTHKALREKHASSRVSDESRCSLEVWQLGGGKEGENKVQILYMESGNKI